MKENTVYLWEGFLEGIHTIQVRALSKGVMIGMDFPGGETQKALAIQCVENSLQVINESGVEVFHQLEESIDKGTFSEIRDKLPDSPSSGTYPCKVVEKPFTKN